jgi:hypothetical protein
MPKRSEVINFVSLIIRVKDSDLDAWEMDLVGEGGFLSK